MKYLLSKIVMTVIIMFFCTVVFGQDFSVKSSPSGNGAILSDFKIKSVGRVSGGEVELCGTSTRNPYNCIKKATVRVKVPVSAKVSGYMYNGKVYNTSYPDCHINSTVATLGTVKITVSIKAGNEIYTVTETLGSQVSGTYTFSKLVDFGSHVPEKSVSYISAVIEPVRDLAYEKKLDTLEECENKKEEEQNNTEEKSEEPEESDFWNGGEKETKTRKIVGISNDNFWIGNDTKESNKDDFWSKADDTQTTQTDKEKDFKIVNNRTYINGHYEYESWVEDTKGTIIIPKGNYKIKSFKYGLAKISVITGYEQEPMIGKITLLQESYLNAKGEIIPPIRKTIIFPNKTASIGALIGSKSHYGETYKQMQERKAREERAKEVRRQKRLEKERQEKAAKERVKAKYRAMGYEID